MIKNLVINFKVYYDDYFHISIPNDDYQVDIKISKM